MMKNNDMSNSLFISTRNKGDDSNQIADTNFAMDEYTFRWNNEYIGFLKFWKQQLFYYLSWYNEFWLFWKRGYVSNNNIMSSETSESGNN